MSKWRKIINQYKRQQKEGGGREEKGKEKREGGRKEGWKEKKS